MTPTLALILRRTAEQHGLDPAAVGGLRPAPEAAPAQRVYCWLALEMTTRSLPAIGLAVGLPPALVRAGADQVGRDRVSHPTLRAELDDLALAIAAETEAIERLRLPGEPDRDPASVAARILSHRRHAVAVPALDAESLAHGYEAQVAAVAELTAQLRELQRDGLGRAAATLIKAERALVAAAHTANERGARIDRDRALKTLTDLLEEPAHAY